MSGSNISILTIPENYSKWESQIKVHFIGISTISLLHLKEKNLILATQTNYKIYNNKRIASIFTKIIDDCVGLI